MSPVSVKKLMSARNQLGVLSRGRLATFWADLQTTYFTKVDNVESIVDQIKQQENTSPLESRSGEHLSFYDYYQDSVIQGIQDFVDYSGNSLFLISYRSFGGKFIAQKQVAGLTLQNQGWHSKSATAKLQDNSSPHQSQLQNRPLLECRPKRTVKFPAS